MTQSKAVIIVSGGMDSVTLLHDIVKNKLHDKVYGISFFYAQRHSKELDCAFKNCEILNVDWREADLCVLGELAPSALTRKTEMPHGHYAAENMKQTVVPNRNMVMLSLAVSYAIGIGARFVYYGAHAGDHAIYPDCRPRFIEAMQKVIAICDWNKVELRAPYINVNKNFILSKGLKLGVDYSITWTCYEGKEKACGKCGSCTERLEAFEKNGIKDPLEYE